MREIDVNANTLAEDLDNMETYTTGAGTQIVISINTTFPGEAYARAAAALAIVAATISREDAAYIEEASRR